MGGDENYRAARGIIGQKKTHDWLRAWHRRGSVAMSVMSLSEVQTQAASLSADERRKLAAFLTVLRMKETGEWEQASKRETQGRAGWISLEEAKRRLLSGN